MRSCCSRCWPWITDERISRAQQLRMRMRIHTATFFGWQIVVQIQICSCSGEGIQRDCCQCAAVDAVVVAIVVCMHDASLKIHISVDMIFLCSAGSNTIPKTQMQLLRCARCVQSPQIGWHRGVTLVQIHQQIPDTNDEQQKSKENVPNDAH